MALSLVAPAPPVGLAPYPKENTPNIKSPWSRDGITFVREEALGGLQPREGNKPSQMTLQPPLLLPQKPLTHVSLCSAPQTLL